MNNLKRVLSLALSTVMLVGMMAVGASAAEFSDADDIQHNDAVNVLVALSVINGKDDGSFDPQGNVTRAEMAKMIAVAMNGGKDTNTGVKGTPSFTDIKGHWAESYIEYCYDLNIISGRGDGTFDPGANVTGLEATKMVLTALGYDATAYRLTGASWAVRTDELAKAADPNLYEELGGVVMATNASRDTAAQLIWNGMQNTTRRVIPSTNTSTGETTWQYQTSSTTMLQERYSANVWIGTYTGNSKSLGLTDEGCVRIGNAGPSTAADEERTNTATFVSDMDISNIGEEVKVIFRDGNGGQKNTPDKKDTIYGVFNTGAVEIVNAVKADVKDNKSEETKVKIGDTKYDLAERVTVVTNYVGEGDPYTGDQLKGTKDTKNSDLTTALQDTTGDTLKLLLKDNKVQSVYVTNTVLAVVTSKNASKITVNNGVGTLEIKDHSIADDLKVDDVVAATVLYKDKATTEGAYAIVTKAESVTGEVSGYKENENVKMDGTTYKIYGKKAMKDLGLADQTLSFTEGDVIGEDFTLYLVNGYVAAAVQTSESASNYSVVLEASTGGTAGSTFDALRLQVMDSEGTKTIINVSDDSEKKATADYAVGSIITYTLDKNNEATVKIVADNKGNSNEAKVGYKKSTKSFNDVVTSTDCVLFASTAADTKGIKAYKIRDLGDVVAQAGKWVSVEKDGKVVAVFVDNGEKPSGATSSTVYGIVSANNGTVKVDGKTYKQFIVDSNDEQYTINISTENVALAKGQIVSFEPTSDNTYGKDAVKAVETGKQLFGAYVDSYGKDDAIITVFTQITKVLDDDKTVIGYEGDKTTQKTYAVKSDVDVYYVDVDSDKGMDSGSITKFDTTEGYANIILVLNSSNEVEVMIVETSGEESIITMPAANEPAPAVCEHSLEKVDAKAGADCQTKGTADHYKCTKCGKLFADNDATKDPIDKAPEGAVGAHDMDTEWTQGEAQHYHACKTANCDHQEDAANHDSNGASGACSVCGKESI